MTPLITSPSRSSHEQSQLVKPGRLFVITGPSGVGKGTLIEQLLQRHDQLHYSVSVTTRLPRAGEQDGINYYFLTRDEFIQLRESGGLLEWAEYANHFYGTPLDPVKEKLQSGQDVLLEIELDGSRQVIDHWPDAIRIFVKPPSMNELERRLRERAKDSEVSIQRRLAQAQTELDAIDEFDYVVTNVDVEQALTDLEVLLFGEPPS